MPLGVAGDGALRSSPAKVGRGGSELFHGQRYVHVASASTYLHDGSSCWERCTGVERACSERCAMWTGRDEPASLN